MQGSTIATYLRELCGAMDAGRPLKRFRWRKAAAQAVIPLALGLGGLGCDALNCTTSEAQPAYAAPPFEQGDPANPSQPQTIEPTQPPTTAPQRIAPEAVDAYGVQQQPTKTPTGQPLTPNSVVPQTGPQPPPNDVVPPAVGAYGAPPNEGSE